MATDWLLRAGSLLTSSLLFGAAAAGLAGVLLPAFGYLPALGGDQFTLQHWHALADMPGMALSTWLSFIVGLAATITSLSLAFVLLAACHGTSGFRLMRHALAPLLSVPHAATAIGLALVIAPSGLAFRLAGFDRPPDILILNDPYGLALILGLALKEVPFFVLVSLAALAQLEPGRQLASARALGYGRITSFAKVLLPQIYRRIRLPVLAVLSYSSAPPEMALLLGPQDPPLLMALILRWMNDPDLSMRFIASAAAVVQCAVVLALLASWLSLERIAQFFFSRLVENGERYKPEAGFVLAASGGGAVMAVLLALGIAALILWSFAESWRFPELLPAGFSLAAWHKAGMSLASPAAATLMLGLAAALCSLVLVCVSLEAPMPLQRAALYAPLILPQVSLLIGLQGMGVESVLLAHILYALPYVLLSLSGPWARLDVRYLQAAASLGAGRMRRLLAVRLPMLAAPLATATALGFAVSAGLYLPTLLMSGGRVATLTTEAVAAASGGDRRIIAIHAILQALMPFCGFALAALLPGLIYRNRRGMRGA